MSSIATLRMFLFLFIGLLTALAALRFRLRELTIDRQQDHDEHATRQKSLDGLHGISSSPERAL